MNVEPDMPSKIQTMSASAARASAAPAPRPEDGEVRSTAAGLPRVWLLMGDRQGDNSQILGLGERLGWPLEIKRFVYTPYEKIVSIPPFGGHLLNVNKNESSPLEPPWPDLVISAGRRNEPIARYIRNQSDHPVRLVHMGRPFAPIEVWDLVVTTPQYRLPDKPNVLHNETPLHRVTHERIAADADRWRDRVSHLARPYVAVLAGGNSGPYPFDAASGERLAQQTVEMVDRLGGSALVTNSARTLDETTEAMERTLDCPHLFYRWRPNDDDNPFFAFLGLADRIIVTADSVSMMTEACFTEKPVYLYDTGEGRTSMRNSSWLDGEAWEGEDADRSGNLFNRWHLKAWIYRQTMKMGPQRLTRDIRIVQKLLVSTGRAVWLGEGDPPPDPPPLRDVERAVERVKALFA